MLEWVFPRAQKSRACPHVTRDSSVHTEITDQEHTLSRYILCLLKLIIKFGLYYTCFSDFIVLRIHFLLHFTEVWFVVSWETF